MSKTTVYAIRDAATKERLTYRYRTVRELKERAYALLSDGSAVEIYRTTQNLPPSGKRRKR